MDSKKRLVMLETAVEIMARIVYLATFKVEGSKKMLCFILNKLGKLPVTDDSLKEDYRFSATHVVSENFFLPKPNCRVTVFEKKGIVDRVDGYNVYVFFKIGDPSQRVNLVDVRKGWEFTLKEQKRHRLDEAMNIAYENDIAEGMNGYYLGAFIENGEIRERISIDLENDEVDLDTFVEKHLTE